MASTDTIPPPTTTGGNFGPTPVPTAGAPLPTTTASAGVSSSDGSQPKIVLHHLNQSRSSRIFWLLEELGLKYEVVVHYRTSIGLAPESLKKINPLGKAPALVVDGKLYTESGAIVHLLLTQFSAPGLEKTASQDSVHWSHFAEGSLMLFLQPAFTIKRASEIATRGVAGMLISPVINKFASWYIGMANGNVSNMLTETETFLETHSNFTGSEEYGEGDFMMIFPLGSIGSGRDAALQLAPKCAAWVDKVHARPAYKRGEERLKSEEEGQKKAAVAAPDAATA